MLDGPWFASAQYMRTVRFLAPFLPLFVTVAAHALPLEFIFPKLHCQIYGLANAALRFPKSASEQREVINDISYPLCPKEIKIGYVVILPEYEDFERMILAARGDQELYKKLPSSQQIVVDNVKKKMALTSGKASCPYVAGDHLGWFGNSIDQTELESFVEAVDHDIQYGYTDEGRVVKGFSDFLWPIRDLLAECSKARGLSEQQLTLILQGAVGLTGENERVLRKNVKEYLTLELKSYFE
jgi:hypothetical protein